MKQTALIIALCALFTTFSTAHTNAESKSLDIKHSGGTDSYGCHIESATGIRHCH